MASPNRADRARHAGRALGAARARHRPPRSEAVERVPHAARREAARLRPGAAGADRASTTTCTGADAHRHGRRHAALHGARAGASARRSTRATDLFAAGAILFEMLAGRPGVRRPRPSSRSCTRRSTSSRRRSRGRRPSPRSTASSGARSPRNRTNGRRRPRRWRTSCARRARRGDDDTPALARALTRLVVLPFRVLRADPETDFLAFSLPDAITTSLSGLGSLVVRSSATAARFAGETPDFKALAAEADVDRVVMGTLLRAGDQLRVVGAARRGAGRHAAHVAHGRRRRSAICSGCRTTSRAASWRRCRCRSARRDVAGAAMPRATRAPTSCICARNELARTYDELAEARDLYERCLELDPSFAPAWARLGRCHRVIGKFISRCPTAKSAPRRRSVARSSSTRG